MSGPSVETLERGTAPGPEGIGYLPAFGRDPARFLMDCLHRYGDVVFFRKGPLRGYVIFHPEHVKYVLEDNIDNYGHGQWIVDKVRATLGTSLFTLDGEAWWRRRRLLDPEFERERILRFSDAIVANTTSTLDRWERRQGSAVDIVEEMEVLSRGNSGKAIFGDDWEQNADVLGPARPLFIDQAGRQLNSPLGLIPLTVPIPFHRRFLAARERYDAVVAQLTAKRRRAADDRDEDLLATLVHLRDPQSGEQMSDRMVRDQVTNIFFLWKPVGITLTRAWWLLAEHPQTFERVREEVETVLHGRPPTVDDLRDLLYTANVVDEVLRLYPPGILQPREAVDDDEIDGYKVRSGTRVVMCSYVTHRHPEFWDDPEQFRPERFAEPSAIRHAYAYSPFGEPGPRRCLGYHIAQMELRLVIAAMAQRFRMRVVGGAAAKTKMGVAQDFSKPIQVQLDAV